MDISPSIVPRSGQAAHLSSNERLIKAKDDRKTALQNGSTA